MRKRRKVKLRSCGVCKPHKRGFCNRWKLKEFDRLVRDEKEVREVTR